MHIIAKTPAALIVEDALSDEIVQSTFDEFRTLTFQTAHAEKYNPVFGLTSRAPLVGEPIVAYGRPPISEEGAALVARLEAPLRALVRFARDNGFVDGDPDDLHLWIRPYVYPVGSALAWHNDGHCAGAFALFVHPHWDPDWGGELLIADETKASRTESVQTAAHVPLRDPGTVAGLSDAVGTFALPTPGRAVFIRSGVHHAIRPVDPAAGGHGRCSIAGFLYGPGQGPRGG